MVLLTRRTLLLGTAAALATGCGSPAPADPTFEPLPGPGDVDNKLARKIPGKRMAALYTLDAPSAVKGAAKPLVTIVEYSDFQCPHCLTAAQALDELIHAYPEDVRIVFRHFPLPFHVQAEPAARAAVAAGLQQRFWAIHDKLFANRGDLSDEAVSGYARELGLDGAKFAIDREDGAVADRVSGEMSTGRGLGVKGTPSMFINGVFVGGMLKPDKLMEVIDGERRVAEELMKAGSSREEIYARFMRAAGAK